ncbi:MAG: hydantoinase B/oxoprolinase family protein, partial [Alphaproteobacteria bacterium]
SNLPVEAIEMEYPLRVEEYSLVEDSGGAGKYRGGMALRRVVRPIGHDCLFNGAGERFSHQPWGLQGGKPGASGRFVLEGGAMAPRRLDDKPSGVMVSPDQRIVVETPGAGGWGDPSERDRAALDEDRVSGKFTDEYMKANYGKDE